MAIHAPFDTIAALGGPALARCDSRSLFQSRFADPEAREQRRDWFLQMVKKPAQGSPVLNWYPEGTAFVYARLMARMMVDLGGGVMENANVRVDRFGWPNIPGSAVKGCARRMALQALHDWVASGTERPASDDACAPCCEGFDDPAAMLAEIALVFGWVEKDWTLGKDGKTRLYCSDLGWACGERHEETWHRAWRIMANQMGWKLPDARAWKGVSSFAGTVAFLPAYPNRAPSQLDIDVLTPHHGEYYQGRKEVATDTEDPVPVFFPAVPAQGPDDYFEFSMIPLRKAPRACLPIVSRWLQYGLNLFGVGAKTNAGYGWFDASEDLQRKIKQRKQDEIDATNEQERHQREREQKQREEDERIAKKKAEEEALAGMTEEQKADWGIEQLTPQQFATKVSNFFKEVKRGGPADDEKGAIVRALRGPRIDFWQEFKTKATKGPLAQAQQAIRAHNKQMNGDKMP